MVAAYFLDSSAVLKRYLSEVGTAWVLALTAKASGNILLISRITSVEILSATLAVSAKQRARRQREGSLTSEQTQTLRTIFQQHFTDQYEIVELTPTLTALAGELCARQSLRAYDAVQLASALTILPIIAQSPENSLTFLTADDRLLRAAQLEHLQADNPNLHP
ncbi:MAG: type II toxin-antitoxin system VapC family toxin [Leptolyngbyaceae cyanobacterium CSU_1_4]|nr:type II toxin-antitoxin system VapC family toxin [Leptolyngbyaceae cyanobacterium CSU_1_4]